ncbi:hypothetical protein [Microbacterium resistens]
MTISTEQTESIGERIQTSLDHSWGSLKTGVGSTTYFDADVHLLIEKAELWLSGQSVVYVEAGWQGRDDTYEDALESNGLWLLVLTNDLVLRVTIQKHPGTTALGQSEWEIVRRRDIIALDAQVEGEYRQPKRVTSIATYEGLKERVEFPSHKDWEVDWEVLQDLFLSLRDDLYLNGCA